MKNTQTVANVIATPEENDGRSCLNLSAPKDLLTPIFSFFPDSGFWGLSHDSLSLTCVTIGLGLSAGAWWNHWRVSNWRQWLPLSLNLLVGNSSAVLNKALNPSSIHVWLLMCPFLRRPSADTHSFWELMVTVAMSCPEYGISPFSPSSSYYILFTFFSTVFLDLGGNAIKILFRAELSTITYSQHPVLPRVSAFTIVHRKKRLHC